MPSPISADRTHDSFNIVAVAASAGGIHALVTVLGGLGADLPVPVLVVQHMDPHHRTVLAEILDRRTGLHVKLAEEGEQARPGTVHIAPPNRHLLVDRDGTLGLSLGDRVHFLRPSADPLFESVADAYGARAVAVVLSGTGNDGAKGVDAVKARGGTVIAQDPETAEFRGMPEAAVGTGAADFVLPLEEISAAIRGLVDIKRQ
ncbi:MULTISPECIES: chemotaxis protein CheB [unclassified Streptomyces]|uniref:chemotaxis protein CheB n=1 Tax=unclassified Streptomyces TaxID=2593676 RepID=UPI002253E274|nr:MULTISPECIES: chemotaxis protein CheB [unclassified Streptomyces]MCX4832973.1 chemotaxis protein CheB [Streptomyces sp. NBC_01016]